MGDSSYTFNCNSFVSTDPNQTPNPNQPTSSCLYSYSDSDIHIVVGGGVNHLIEMHGYQNNPQLEIDVENCLV